VDLATVGSCHLANTFSSCKRMTATQSARYC